MDNVLWGAVSVADALWTVDQLNVLVVCAFSATVVNLVKKVLYTDGGSEQDEGMTAVDILIFSFINLFSSSCSVSNPSCFLYSTAISFPTRLGEAYSSYTTAPDLLLFFRNKKSTAMLIYFYFCALNCLY